MRLPVQRHERRHAPRRTHHPDGVHPLRQRIHDGNARGVGGPHLHAVSLPEGFHAYAGDRLAGQVEHRDLEHETGWCRRSPGDRHQHGVAGDREPPQLFFDASPRCFVGNAYDEPVADGTDPPHRQSSGAQRLQVVEVPPLQPAPWVARFPHHHLPALAARGVRRVERVGRRRGRPCRVGHQHDAGAGRLEVRSRESRDRAALLRKGAGVPDEPEAQAVQGQGVACPAGGDSGIPALDPGVGATGGYEQRGGEHDERLSRPRPGELGQEKIPHVAEPGGSGDRQRSRVPASAEEFRTSGSARGCRSGSQNRSEYWRPRRSTQDASAALPCEPPGAGRFHR